MYENVKKLKNVIKLSKLDNGAFKYYIRRFRGVGFLLADVDIVPLLFEFTIIVFTSESLKQFKKVKSS